MASKAKTLYWTMHSRAKMRQYRLSPQRVRAILNSPKRIEEGVAPKTMAAMQPSFVKTTEGKPGERKESWTQELWVMVQDAGRARKIISAWRYPGMSKPRELIAMSIFRNEYLEFIEAAAQEMEKKFADRPKIKIGLKWRGDLPPDKPKKAWPKRPFRRPGASSAIQLD